MNINFACPTCGAKLVLGGELAGREVRCPKCGNTSVAPAPVAAPPPAPVPVAAPTGGSQRPCPYCGEQIEVAAKKCRHCNEWLDPAMRQQAAAGAANPADADMSTVEWIVALLCSGIGCIVGIVYLCQGKPKGKKMFLISLGMCILWNIISAASGMNRMYMH